MQTPFQLQYLWRCASGACVDSALDTDSQLFHWLSLTKPWKLLRLCAPANLTPCQIKTASLPIMPFDSPLPLKRIQSALYSPYVHSQILSQKSHTQYFLSFLISQKNSLSWKPIYFSFHSLPYTHARTHITFMLTQYTVLYSQYKAWRQVLD